MHSEFNRKEWKNNVQGVLLPTQFCQSWDTGEMETVRLIGQGAGGRGMFSGIVPSNGVGRVISTYSYFAVSSLVELTVIRSLLCG